MWTTALGVFVSILLLVWQSLFHDHDYVPATLRPMGIAKVPSARLPTAVRPLHYDLSILSDLEHLHFYGGVNITLHVEQPTSVLEFHASPNLKMGNVRIATHSGEYLAPPQRIPDRERVRVSLPRSLEANERAYILVNFRAPIDHSMRGYYYSTWRHNGESGHYALTQFEPTSARRAFPCWDEPSYKATYSFRMLHSENTTALANMPSVRRRGAQADDMQQLLHASPDLRGAWLITEFDTTPRMSTYLVAWANGAFQHVSNTAASPLTGRKIPVSLYTTPEFIQQAAYTTDVMARVLAMYEKVFRIAYPLPKLDALVSADFDFGAMENWGLITGRTSVFLHDETMGLRGQKNAASVMSHEIAHMWFGDIATMAWWDNLWLNEAFATLMGEAIILDRVYPAWKSSREFVVMHWMRALELDAMRSSHAVEIPFRSARVEDEIAQVFDAISYSKGASVLRMLAQMLGEDVFLRGVSRYLQRHLYGNTRTDDLWDAISEVSGRDIRTLMTSWVRRQGYPVITATESGSFIYVRQNRFLSSGDPSPEEDDTLWHVPLGLKVPGAVNKTLTLPGVRAMTMDNINSSMWKLNADTMGVYRVAYAPSHLEKLGRSPPGFLSVEDRIGLLDDAFALAQAGYSKTSAALTLTHAFRNETSQLVLQAMAVRLEHLASVWWERPERAMIEHFQADVFGPLARQLSFEGDGHEPSDVRELRATVIAAAAAGGDAWTIGEIRRRFAPLQSRNESLIHPDLVRTILSHAVKHGGEAEYETALRMYREPRTPLHRNYALMALGNTQQPALIERTIKLVFDGEVPLQDYTYIFQALANNVHSRRRLWEATKQHFDELSGSLRGNFGLMGVVKAAVSSLSSTTDLDDVRHFFQTRNDTSLYSLSLAQSIEAVASQSHWLARDADDVQAWLVHHTRS